MVTSKIREDELRRYKDYCERRNINFFTGIDMEEFIEKLGKINDIEKRRNFILKKLGVEIKERSFLRRLFG